MNGDKYEGKFRFENMLGQGTFTWANGDHWTGEFMFPNKKNGTGTFYDAAKQIESIRTYENDKLISD